MKLDYAFLSPQKLSTIADWEVSYSLIVQQLEADRQTALQHAADLAAQQTEQAQQLEGASMSRVATLEGQQAAVAEELQNPLVVAGNTWIGYPDAQKLSTAAELEATFSQCLLIFVRQNQLLHTFMMYLR